MTADVIRKLQASLQAKPEHAPFWEIAFQLATLNEKLEPARLVSAIEEIQGELDKRDKRGKS
jgi:hypothetical protein